MCRRAGAIDLPADEREAGSGGPHSRTEADVTAMAREMGLLSETARSPVTARPISIRSADGACQALMGSPRDYRKGR